MLAEVLAESGIRVLGKLPPNGKDYWAGRFWDRESEERHPVLGSHYLQEKNDLAKMIEEYAGGTPRVLEFCCGTGEFIQLTNTLAEPREIVATDISEHALARAAERGPYGNVRLVHGDFWDDSHDLGTANVVLCIDSLQHLGNVDEVLRRLRSFVAPGGVLIGNVWTRDYFHELERLRYGRLEHVTRSAKFLGSAILIRISGGRLRSDNYRTKLTWRSEIESLLHGNFDTVPALTHHRYHTAFACRVA